MSPRRRLDAEMVARGLTESRTEASRLIEEGHVTVSGAPAGKASRLVAAGEPIEILATKRWVGRGADKLEHALMSWSIQVDGRGVIDAGSSTGGFTQVLLERSARIVCAVDVGRHQLHEKLRSDPRVRVLEQTDIRSLAPSDLPCTCSLLVADLSFISLVTVMPHLVALVGPEERHPQPELVLLVKPQFEVGRKEVSKAKGVIRDPDLRQSAIDRVAESVEAHGGLVAAVIESPITGAEGNVEYLMHVVVPVRP